MSRSTAPRPAHLVGLAISAIACAVWLAGCSSAMVPTSPQAKVSHLSRAAAVLPAGLDITASLARFSLFEGKKVTAKHIPMNDGRGAAELNVPLTPDEKSLMEQLYRLHPRPVPAGQYPEGLLQRTAEHLAVLHHFKLPGSPELVPGTLVTTLKARCYKDGEGKIIAFESFQTGTNFMLFGKYDLQGHILKIDVETWK